MTTPEWTSVEKSLRARRWARQSLVAVLVALGVLGGVGLGIPIGREQQARVDAQPTGEPHGGQSANDVMAPRPLPPASVHDGLATYPRRSIDL
jgi:hypothetical protein